MDRIYKRARESVENKRLTLDHNRKHRMVYGWLVTRFSGDVNRRTPMLAYEWREHEQMILRIFR